MTLLITERAPTRSQWPSDISYPPCNNNEVPETINSPPNMTVLFPSVHRTDASLYCFIL